MCRWCPKVSLLFVGQPRSQGLCSKAGLWGRGGAFAYLEPCAAFMAGVWVSALVASCSPGMPASPAALWCHSAPSWRGLGSPLLDRAMRTAL